MRRLEEWICFAIEALFSPENLEFDANKHPIWAFLSRAFTIGFILFVAILFLGSFLGYW